MAEDRPSNVMEGTRDGRKIYARFCRMGEEEKEFDRWFWREQGPEGKWQATWLMVRQLYLIRGQDVPELRLRRDVEVLKRRGS